MWYFSTDYFNVVVSFRGNFQRYMYWLHYVSCNSKQIRAIMFLVLRALGWKYEVWIAYLFVIYQMPLQTPFYFSVGEHVSLFVLNEPVGDGTVNLFEWTRVNSVQKYLKSCGDYWHITQNIAYFEVCDWHNNLINNILKDGYLTFLYYFNNYE